jgi:hypothetical protein
MLPNLNRSIGLVSAVVLGLSLGACGSGGSGGGSGGSGSGGRAASGGEPGSGGAPGSGGEPGSGGMVGTGGAATGGAATGGAATGGAATGGAGGAAAGGGGGIATGGAGGAATGGAATGGVATGGVATGGVATGGAGGLATGGAGGDAGTGGAPATCTGCAVLSVPFTAPSQSQVFRIDPGVTFNMGSATSAVFRMCVASAEPDTTVQASIQMASFSAGAFGTSLSTAPGDNGLSTCPAMTDVALPFAGTSLDPALARYINVTVASGAAGTFGTGPTVIHLDSITVAGNGVGPYEFGFNKDPIFAADTPIAGTTVTWLGPGSAPLNGPGAAVLSVPFTAAGTANMFEVFLPQPVDMSGGETITYTLCLASVPTPATYVQFFLQAATGLNFANIRRVTPVGGANVIPACPTMLPVTINVAGDTLDTTAVRQIGIKVGVDGPDAGATFTSPTVLRIDSITVSSNVVGPYNFVGNRHPMTLNPYMPVTGSDITWTPGP